MEITCECGQDVDIPEHEDGVICPNCLKVVSREQQIKSGDKK